ncbi:MAG: response regulator receiver modulated serine phosphatase [Parcubacteria group bacterium Gr01-1014_33]|nr:MAG: response regulator receiver modulated serine phosphatase [Parcubacteria group bacterium Gr01-1014_33]
MFLRQLLVEKFTKEGYEVREASDGREALQYIAENPPHIVILDLLMPEVDGFQVLEKLRADARTKNLPVVVLSNLGEQEHVNRVKALGADDYLIKAHLFLDEIVARISDVLKKRYL